jgi:D-glycero-D-manno-heptose 1,7-bisphosphate phosphatase
LIKDRALFLDRDGTLVHARHYPSRPEQLVLYDGIGDGLRELQSAGFKLVVVTNQSGIARGYFTEADLDAMHRHLRQQLAAVGAHLDAIYHCPHHEHGVLPALAIRCDCRKPQSGMLRRAATDLNLDLERSWLVGDILDDVEAGRRAGCRTVLVDLGTESPPDVPMRTPHYVARDIRHALDIVRARSGLSPDADYAYRPASWRGAVPGWTSRVHASSRAEATEGGQHAISR